MTLKNRPIQYDRYAIITDRPIAMNMSQPYSNRHPNVAQKEQHFEHLDILVKTLAIASVSPRCCANTAHIITIDAITNIRPSLCSGGRRRNRNRQRRFADERTGALLTARRRHGVHGRTLCNRDRRGCCRRNRHGEVLRQRLRLRTVAAALACDIGDDTLNMDSSHVLPGCDLRHAFQRENRRKDRSLLHTCREAQPLRDVHLYEVRRSNRTERQNRRNARRLDFVEIAVTVIHNFNMLCLLLLVNCVRAGGVRLG